MPLLTGSSKQTISHNIAAEVAAGKPQDQAVAIAYSVARRGKKKQKGDQAKMFIPIQKLDFEKREVWGTMAEERIDKVDEIFDYASSKPHFVQWSDAFKNATGGKSLGNVREMHGPSAVGKVIALDFDDGAKKIAIGTKIVDDAAWEKCVEGVYTGFSMGGKYARLWDDPVQKGARRYTGVPAETSLVDNPCMYGATFQVIKADGATELRKFTGAARTMSDAELKKFATDVAATVLAKLKPEAEPTPLAKVCKAIKEIPGGPANRSVVAEDFIEKSYPRALAARAAKPIGKSMYDVGCLAGILCQLSAMEDCLKSERDYEGDESKIPEALNSVLKSLKQVFLDLASEEANELIQEEEGAAAKAANADQLNKEITGMLAAYNALTKLVESGDAALLAKEAPKHLKEIGKHVEGIDGAHSKMGKHISALKGEDAADGGDDESTEKVASPDGLEKALKSVLAKYDGEMAALKSGQEEIGKAIEMIAAAVSGRTLNGPAPSKVHVAATAVTKVQDSQNTEDGDPNDLNKGVTDKMNANERASKVAANLFRRGPSGTMVGGRDFSQ